MPMFQARMTPHKLSKRVETDDGLGFTYPDYSEPSDVLLYLTKPTPTDFNQNEFYAQQQDATAFTYEEVNRGDLIDSEWQVKTVEQMKNGEYCLGLVAYGEQ